MSQEVRQTELKEKTQKLLHGSLKYVRAAALAAALLPLASVAAAPAAQDPCPSGGVCEPPSPGDQPGTGTPGYWKTHPEAWPVDSLEIGGVTYTKAQAIAILGNTGKDKTTTMFGSLVPATLNVMLGNDGSCVEGDIAAGNDWLVAHPVGSNVGGGTDAWVLGEPTHIRLDSYNNGLLCAPHRQ